MFILSWGCGLVAACTPTMPFVREKEVPSAPAAAPSSAVAQVEFQEPALLPLPSQPHVPTLTNMPTGEPLSAAPATAPARALVFSPDPGNLLAMAERPQPAPPEQLVEKKPESPQLTDKPASVSRAEPKPCTEVPPRPLARAINAFLNNRPDEAVQHLQGYAPKDQELVMQLLPILAEVDRDGVLTDQPRQDKVQTVLTSLRSLDTELRPHAPLVMEKLSFCQGKDIEAFGVVKKRAGNLFRAGDYPFIYAELQNLVDQRGSDGRYSVRLASALEIRAADGRAVHKYPAIQNEPLYSWSPRTDYFTRIGLQLPVNLAPGLYSLRVRVTDLETGRTAEQGLPFQVVPTSMPAAQR